MDHHDRAFPEQVIQIQHVNPELIGGISRQVGIGHADRSAKRPRFLDVQTANHASPDNADPGRGDFQPHAERVEFVPRAIAHPGIEGVDGTQAEECQDQREFRHRRGHRHRCRRHLDPALQDILADDRFHAPCGMGDDLEPRCRGQHLRRDARRSPAGNKSVKLPNLGRQMLRCPVPVGVVERHIGKRPEPGVDLIVEQPPVEGWSRQHQDLQSASGIIGQHRSRSTQIRTASVVIPSAARNLVRP